MRKKFPSMTHAEIIKEMSNDWKAMSEVAKKPWIAMQQKDEKRLDKDLKKWRSDGLKKVEVMPEGTQEEKEAKEKARLIFSTPKEKQARPRTKKVCSVQRFREGFRVSKAFLGRVLSTTAYQFDRVGLL